jgi:hypothetical protein
MQAGDMPREENSLGKKRQTNARMVHEKKKTHKRK